MVYLYLKPKYIVHNKIMKSKEKLEKKIIDKFCKILSINKKELLNTKNFSDIENWDSLKHLEIITELDKILNKRLKKVKNPSQLTSLKKIISLI